MTIDRAPEKIEIDPRWDAHFKATRPETPVPAFREISEALLSDYMRLRAMETRLIALVDGKFGSERLEVSWVRTAIWP